MKHVTVVLMTCCSESISQTRSVPSAEAVARRRRAASTLQPSTVSVCERISVSYRRLLTSSTPSDPEDEAASTRRPSGETDARLTGPSMMDEKSRGQRRRKPSSEPCPFIREPAGGTSLLKGHIGEVQRVVVAQADGAGAQRPPPHAPQTDVVPTTRHHPEAALKMKRAGPMMRVPRDEGQQLLVNMSPSLQPEQRCSVGHSNSLQQLSAATLCSSPQSH
ncbi:hypothetical protein EYF80_047024 [Liparis tanakae]|uniref:Uncharacterized protein n=1 Tax=Liparis tanakae TaxID=230148 RepID=A0A4Z2FPD8_9TELE|nr:hypothetical protein EYF80_047024 [Liparis tanakae]